VCSKEVAALVPALNAEIAGADRRLQALATGSTVVTRLATVPGIGPITALAFVAALDDVARFRSAHEVEAYLGLVPSEYRSGDRRLRGRITKRGDVRTRWLLVEAAWRIMRSPDPGVGALKAWGEQLARRRGKAIAAVAIARRLAGILYALWRDKTEYRPLPTRSAA
jgi:transposase